MAGEGVAQLVEQRPFKPWVVGSIPATFTKRAPDSIRVRSFFYVKQEVIHLPATAALSPISPLMPRFD